MLAMKVSTLVLFISSLGLVQQAVSQDVEIRGPNESQADLDGGSGSSGGGQSRTIYSQRHLSPHRMMHFGKRPISAVPPIINSWPSYYELMPTDVAGLAPFQSRQAIMQQRQQQDLVSANNYQPFEFSIKLENGRTLMSVPEDTISQARAASSYQLPSMGGKLIYDYGATQPNGNQLTFAPIIAEDAAAAAKRGQQQLLRQLFGHRQASDAGSSQRLSKLVENDESKSSNDEVNNNNGDSQDNNNNSQEQPNAISVSTRSMHSMPGRQNTLSLPRAYVSQIYGHQSSSSSMPNFGAYNKKAEPKDNFFMHFGRK